MPTGVGTAITCGSVSGDFSTCISASERAAKIYFHPDFVVLLF